MEIARWVQEKFRSVHRWQSNMNENEWQWTQTKTNIYHIKIKVHIERIENIKDPFVMWRLRKWLSACRHVAAEIIHFVLANPGSQPLQIHFSPHDDSNIVSFVSLSYFRFCVYVKMSIKREKNQAQKCQLLFFPVHRN